MLPKEHSQPPFAATPGATLQKYPASATFVTETFVAATVTNVGEVATAVGVA